MDTIFYAVLSKHGFVRANKVGIPTLKKGERAVKIHVHVEDAAFGDTPIPEVKLELTPQQLLGVQFDGTLKVMPPPKEKKP
jgi:hypothetical protein